MPSNNRVYYAVNAVGFAEYGGTGYIDSSGVQSVGINTNFNLEPVFQLGQLEVYENVESIPDVELTIEKVIDGSALIQHLATPQASASTLAGRYSNNRANVAMAYYSDENVSASGYPGSVVFMSGMYINSINFNFSVDGPFTESVTLVGNDKTWATGVLGGPAEYEGTHAYLPDFSNDDSPPSNAGVHFRENLKMSGCIWPDEIPGVLADNVNDDQGDKFDVHFQSIDISVDLGRTELFELGRRGPYHRYADFPTEVTCAIEIIESEQGDFIDASSTASSNVSNQPIFFLLSDDTRINLGSSNRLSSVSSTGGDTGGGNRTTTYTYSNYNNLQVEQSADPAGQTF